MTLLETQRRVAEIVMRPLTRDERMRASSHAAAEQLIKPNSRLTAGERIEIYNRQYWFRILSSFAEDFPGVRRILGARRFSATSKAYLSDCPSISFTLRNLGSRFAEWLMAHGFELVAVDMARLEWAHIEAFDEPAGEPLAHGEVSFALQPYLRFLELDYPVDNLLLALRAGKTRAKVPDPEKTFVAVHRVDNTVYYKRLDEWEFHALSALFRGESIESALESIDVAPAELQAAFANWAELGWFRRP